MSRAGSMASRSRSARGFQAIRMGGFHRKEITYSMPCAPGSRSQRTVRRVAVRSLPPPRTRTYDGLQQRKKAHLTEGGTVVDGGGLGDQADAGGILGDLGDTEPVGGVATGLLVGSGPHGEGEGNPEADDLPPHAAVVIKIAF